MDIVVDTNKHVNLSKYKTVGTDSVVGDSEDFSVYHIHQALLFLTLRFPAVPLPWVSSPLPRVSLGPLLSRDQLGSVPRYLV